MADPASFSSVKLQLRFNGANNSTTFTDDSLSARTVTVYGNTKISTAWSKFGGASGAFDSNGDYLTVATHADFDFGSGDWTIEFWYRRDIVTSGLTQYLMGKQEGSPNYRGPFSIYITPGNTIRAGIFNAAGTEYTVTTTTQIFDDQVCHVVLERAGNTFRLYIDGVSEGSNTFTGAVYATSEPLCIGYDVPSEAASSGGGGLLGYMDDLRITKGEALYGGTSFTPPTTELPEAPTTTGARILAAGPLGAASAVARVTTVASLSAPGPLAAAAVIAEHDFTAVIEALGLVDYYTCDLVDGTTLQVPISSWQGTQQTDGACYLQAVIPAVADLAATINALTATAEFVIKRCARLPDGFIASVELARSVIEQVQLDRGPQRYTCTISGYSAAIVAPGGDGPPQRVLQGVRSISTGTSGTRTRCDINWLLRPGGAALADDVPLVADYINYYVQGRDAYMDVGERV